MRRSLLHRNRLCGEPRTFRPDRFQYASVDNRPTDHSERDEPVGENAFDKCERGLVGPSGPTVALIGILDRRPEFVDELRSSAFRGAAVAMLTGSEPATETGGWMGRNNRIQAIRQGALVPLPHPCPAPSRRRPPRDPLVHIAPAQEIEAPVSQAIHCRSGAKLNCAELLSWRPSALARGTRASPRSAVLEVAGRGGGSGGDGAAGDALG